MTMKRLMARLLVGVAVSNCVPAAAATFSLLDKDAVAMVGQIVDGDAERLADVMVKAERKGYEIKRMWVHSPGGEVGAAGELAELVHELDIQVGVAPKQVCNSACVLVFAAGFSRVVYSTSKVGVHSAGDIDVADANNPKAVMVETPGSRATTVLLARAMASYGAPASVVNKLITTQPDGIAWLNISDYRAWGVEVRP